MAFSGGGGNGSGGGEAQIKFELFSPKDLTISWLFSLS